MIKDFGELENYQMPGSRTYNALKSTDRFKDFGASDKLREYATWQVLANKYGAQDAISNLETSMIDYAHNHEGGKEWISDVFLNNSQKNENKVQDNALCDATIGIADDDEGGGDSQLPSGATYL